MGPKAERKRCACLADLNLRIFFSRNRVGWCEFSARLFNTRVLPMLDTWQDLTFRCSIALQLIGDDHTWNIVQSCKELTEKSLGSFFSASALHQDIQHVPLLIHRSPQIVSLTTNRKKHLVQMPLVATTRTAMSQL